MPSKATRDRMDREWRRKTNRLMAWGDERLIADVVGAIEPHSVVIVRLKPSARDSSAVLLELEAAREVFLPHEHLVGLQNAIRASMNYCHKITFVTGRGFYPGSLLKLIPEIEFVHAV